MECGVHSRAIRCLVLALLVLAVPIGARGQANKDAIEERKTRKVQAVREFTYKKLIRAHEAMKEGDLATAQEEIESLMRRRSLNDHEQAAMWQTYGYIQSEQEDYRSAAESFKKAVDLDALPFAAQQNTTYNLAQLHLANENYDLAIRTLIQWFRLEPSPQPQAFYLLSLAYMQSGRPEKAIRPAEIAVRQSDEPKEPWLQLLMALHFEQKHFKEVLGVLEQLIALYPKRTYWLQLSGVYSELGQELDALAALELAYTQGMLKTENELMNFARMYLYHSIPYHAAKVVEKGMEDGIIEPSEKSWKLLADSWLHARELQRGLEPLQTAAKLSDKGDLYVRLGQVHLEREEWTQASSAFESALAKGDLADAANAHLMLGIASASAKDIARARKAFQQARRFPTTKKPAEQWLEHLDRQQN